MDRPLLRSRWEDLPPFIHNLQRHTRVLNTRIAEATNGVAPAAVFRRYVFRTPSLLILLWIWLLQWGEVRVYNKEVKDCDWTKWERWPKHATPHHVAFVADPQLVDPHTYPGRPWPLSSLTIAFTDKYLKRSYNTLHRHFDPDTVYFLGDLFDGGREWSTGTDFHLVDSRWTKYGARFWSNEYQRFANIFFKTWRTSDGKPERKEKNIIASLPGNHDLGFATGVQLPVRQRFQAYFGKGDRVDIIGNHTFVGLDTVSLSAMDIADAQPEIWRPTNDFLDRVKDAKQEATQNLLRGLPGPANGRRFLHKSVEPTENGLAKPAKQPTRAEVSDLPTVLLSHVPLYREPGTRCGWQREKWPPIKLDQEFEESNAIRVAAGYQYQNVLTKQLTKTIAEKVGNVDYAFSGDDHDYCELTHHAYPSAGRGIHEITVKSLSFAMGVNRPGFVLASLWNPIDENGTPIPGSPGGLRNPTLHSHLCLLPNQLAIYIQYAFYLFITLVVILVSSTITTLLARNKPDVPRESGILPTRQPNYTTSNGYDSPNTAVSGVSAADGKASLAARPVGSRTRVSNPANGVGGYSLPSGPLIDRYDSKKSDDPWDSHTRVGRKKKQLFIVQWAEQLGRDIIWVGLPSLMWFLWLWHKH